MRKTAKQVAQALGVSPATVSLALRGKPGVSDALRRKILETASGMGVSAHAESFATPIHSLQMVIFKSHGAIISDTPFFEQLTQGVADGARARGYLLSISYLYGEQDMPEQLQSINSFPCDGVILLATEMRLCDVEKLRVIHHPIVLLDNFFPTASYDCISIDNASGASKAVQYLIRMGHSRIGYLHSKVDIRNFRERKSGYLSACRLLPEPDSRDASRRIISVGATTESAYRDMCAYLEEATALPTAFFADNDRIAVGCCQALQRYGIRIPEDVSVIGFDNSSLCTTLAPELSSMNVQKQRMGALAIDRLAAQVEAPIPETVHITVVPDVVARGTVLQLRDPSRKGYL